VREGGKEKEGEEEEEVRDEEVDGGVILLPDADHSGKSAIISDCIAITEAQKDFFIDLHGTKSIGTQ